MTNEIKEAEKPNAAGAGDGNKPEANTLIDSANSAAERLEKATQSLKAENERREQILAREMLGGKSSGNAETLKKEETAKEYAKRVMQGKV